MAYQDEQDAFSDTPKVPSLSWRELPIGSVFVLEVLEPAKVLHSRDYRTNEPKYWDPLTKLNPVLSAVVNVRVLEGPHSVGEPRSVWAQRPSDMYAAVATAQKEAGAKLQPGGILKLKFVGQTPHKDPKNNPIKNYAAHYQPPANAFADAPSSPQQYAQPAQTTQPVPPPRPYPGQEAPPARPASWGAAPAAKLGSPF